MKPLRQTVCACIDHLYSEKTVTDSCALHKMLLVVFFHPRALTQCSYSTDTGSSRASLNCLCQCDTECPAMVCIPVYCSRELFPILDTVAGFISGGGQGVLLPPLGIRLPPLGIGFPSF